MAASIRGNGSMKARDFFQERYTADLLTKRHKKNEGELPQYYIENSHPAIISPEEFELVQAEHKRRSAKKKDKWSGMIICGDCGCAYGRKIWHSTDKFRSIAYRCNGKYDGEEKCKTPSIKEEEVKSRFIRAYNSHKETEPGKVPESKEREIEREIEDWREKVYAAGASWRAMRK